MSLRSKLLNASVRSRDGRSFLPTQSIIQILTKSEVEAAVIRCVQDVCRRKEAVKMIMTGGQRLFGLLLLIRQERLVVHFLDTDNLQSNTLDSRLPMELSALLSFLPSGLDSEVAAQEFADKQWEFLAPVFDSELTHRTFDDMTILPFIWGKDYRSWEGAFGVVDEVMLHKCQHRYHHSPAQDVSVVRKKIKTDTEVKAGTRETGLANHDFIQEQSVLLFMRSLKHPHIIDLLASYTYRLENILLFPAADSNLAEAFSNDSLSQLTNEELYKQLCGLSSALQHVHNYFSTEYDLRMIGCHHDLKPKNILLIKKKFLLADFGLSKLKDSDDSKSVFTEGDRQYLAPECETFRDDLTVCKNLIGRSSDIWAFGAVLSEIMTYRIKGNAGLTEFLKCRRKTLYETYVVSQFHHGGKACKEVNKWLDGLQESSKILDAKAPMHLTAWRPLLDLIRDMLSIVPNGRPNAEETTLRLFRGSHCFLFSKCTMLLDNLLHSNYTLELRIEQERMRLFGQFNNLLAGVQPRLLLKNSSEQHLQRISSLLMQISNELRSLEFAMEAPTSYPIFGQLRSYIDGLWLLCPSTSREEMRVALTSDLLCLDESLLETLSLVPQRSAIYKDIGILAAMKFITLHMDQLGQEEVAGHNLYLPTKRISNITSFALHEISDYSECEEDSKRTVLIENMRYNANWIHDGHGQELLDRVAGVANIFHKSQVFSTLHVLDCLGFMHQPDKLSVSLVFRLPSPGGDTVRPLCLRDVIISLSPRRAIRPLLGDVFNLAHTLAKGLLEYHTVRWLHKGISTYNIAFFPRDHSNEALLAAFREPYLIGFNHSRQSEEKLFTQGPPSEQEARPYLHPQYISEHCVRFEERYDYYSLGIVLLELGLWHFVSDWTLSEKWRRLALDAYEKRDKILEEILPRVGSTMGQMYMEVVRICLTAEQSLPSGDFGMLARSIQTLIITPLSQLLFV